VQAEKCSCIFLAVNYRPSFCPALNTESCQCGQCGNTLVKISEDVTEQLDMEPAKFFVHRHLCPVGISARNTPAVSVKPSLPQRSHRR